MDIKNIKLGDTLKVVIPASVRVVFSHPNHPVNNYLNGFVGTVIGFESLSYESSEDLPDVVYARLLGEVNLPKDLLDESLEMMTDKQLEALSLQVWKEDNQELVERIKDIQVLRESKHGMLFHPTCLAIATEEEVLEHQNRLIRGIFAK